MKHLLFSVLTITLIGAATESARAGGNLVLNPGFETGDFTGWTTHSAASGSDFFVSNASPHSGTYEATFAGFSVGNYDGISQNLATTAGDSYTFSFWLKNTASLENDFQAYWGGAKILDVLNANAFAYTQYTFTETASSSSTTILFQGYQLPGAFQLDDVSVTPAAAVPEPASIFSLAAGLGGVFWYARRKRAA